MMPSNYLEFRHGKLVSARDSGYHLVARTHALADDAALKKIAQTYSFWGTRPPTGSRWALGLTHELNGLMIVKKTPALHRDGATAISGQRGFDLSRYVTLPTAVVQQTIAGQTFRLLDWIDQDTIWPQATADDHLAAPNLPILEQPLSETERDNASEMLYRSAQIVTEVGSPLLLLALESLLLGKRLLFSFQMDALDFWKSLLLLLPAACRAEIAIAMGTVDEAVCNWAHIIVKDGASSSYNLSDDLIKVNLTARSLEAKSAQSQPSLQYVDLLKPLLGSLESVKGLMQVLDSASDWALSLAQVADLELPPELEFSLIRLLPAAERFARLEKYLEAYVARLSDSTWATLLPLLQQKDEVLCVWQQMQSRSPSNIEMFVPKMGQLWPHLPLPNQIAFLESPLLQQNSGLATAWVKTVLLTAEPTVADVQTTQYWLSLCRAMVSHQAQREPKVAMDMATAFAECKLFQQREHFWLFDAVLADRISSDDANIVVNNRLSPLIVQMNGFEKSCLYRHLLKRDARLEPVLALLSDQKIEAIAHLPKLATSTGMTAPQQNAFYLSFLETLQPTFEQAKALLETFISQDQLLSAHSDTPQRLAKTLAWFTAKQPEFEVLLGAMQQNLQSWDRLMQLAQYFRDRLETQTIYADDLVKRYGFTELVQTALCAWLAGIRQGEIASAVFQTNSQVWRSLQSDDIGAITLSHPQLIPQLIAELVKANRVGEIGGSLLHQLICGWESGEPVDQSLLTLVGNPAVTQTYAEADWLVIARICWHSNIQGWIASRPKALSAQGKQSLVQQAEKAIATYNNPQQIAQLLADCETWHLSLEDRREILLTANPQICETTLVRDYLDDPNGILDLTQSLAQSQIIRFFLQTQPQAAEELDYQQVLVNLLLQGSQSNHLPAWLQDATAISRPDLYQISVSTVAKRLISSNVEALKQIYQQLNKQLPASQTLIKDTFEKEWAAVVE